MVDSLPPLTPLGVLTKFCADCHAGRGNDGEALGNIDYILDISRLAKEGWIIPLYSDGSPIVQMMRDGTMPPGVLEKPTAREIDVVARYIDNPNFWPEPAPVVETLDGGTAVGPGDAG